MTNRPGDSAGSILPHEGNCQRKRHRHQSTCEGVEPSAKRRKAASYNYPPRFWNTLSKITLTRGAVKEFDRRTAKEKSTSEGRVAERSTRLLRSDTKKLLYFAKNGGLNLNHLRSYADPPKSVVEMDKPSSSIGKHTPDSLPSSDVPNGTGTTGPYNSNFQQKLTDIGLFPTGYEDSDGNSQQPENIGSLRKLLRTRRNSLSCWRFTENDFADFQRADEKAISESKVMSNVIPIILGVNDRHFETQDNIRFNNFEKFDADLKTAQPDKYYGARPEQIDERVRRDLGKYIVPSTNTAQPILPNFFFEGKSVAGRFDVVKRQVMYDNAFGARAIFQLQNYGKEPPIFDGNAYTIGSSYVGGTLKLYATHPRQSATGGIEYHMTQLDAYAMTGNIDTFRRGAAAYRNSRDFTQKQRDKFVAKANAIARSVRTDGSSSKN